MSAYRYDPQAFRQFSVCLSLHAPLLQIQEPYRGGKPGRWLNVGSPGEYGPIDRDTGAQYTALGWEDVHKGRRRIVAQSDLRCGMFYPETIFVYGIRESEDEFLPLTDVEEFTNTLYPDGSQKPVRLLYGFTHGTSPRPIWREAMRFAAFNRPEWHGIEKRLQRQFPDALVRRIRDSNFAVVLGLHTAYPSTDPTLAECALGSFMGSPIYQDGMLGETVQCVHESGCLHIVCARTGARWRVTDIDNEGMHSFGFEREEADGI